MRKFVLVSVSVPALLVGAYVNAQTPSPRSESPAPTSSEGVAPDNTKSNKVDPSNRGAVADDSKNDSSDIDLAKRIRQSVMADKGLSTYGHNVKIVAVHGTVTLNGVVNTADEKAKIEEKATSIAGAGKVVDDLKVAPVK